MSVTESETFPFLFFWYCFDSFHSAEMNETFTQEKREIEKKKKKDIENYL